MAEFSEFRKIYDFPYKYFSLRSQSSLHFEVLVGEPGHRSLRLLCYGSITHQKTHHIIKSIPLSLISSTNLLGAWASLAALAQLRLYYPSTYFETNFFQGMLLMNTTKRVSFAKKANPPWNLSRSTWIPFRVGHPPSKDLRNSTLEVWHKFINREFWIAHRLQNVSPISKA